MAVIPYVQNFSRYANMIADAVVDDISCTSGPFDNESMTLRMFLPWNGQAKSCYWEQRKLTDE